MCCLFGFLDYGHKLTRKQRSRLLTVLSTACEERGTDATGIAYNSEGRLHIFKRPLPAHLMWYRVPLEANAVMGHTRMTTQGSEKQNQNNHPFFGKAGDTRFALAHNGVLCNDRTLRKKKKLPVTRIETDSYVAVQLLERYGELSFDSLQSMAEDLEGTFTITTLSGKDELYFVKGNTYGGTYLHPVESRLVPYFGEAALQDILPIHVQDYVNKMAKKYKPETIKKDITVLSFIMQNAVDNGLCKINPVAKSVRLPKIERAEKTAYTQAQYDTVYEFAKNHPNGLAIMVLMETGISRSELLGLTWDDFDRENGVLHITQGLVSYKDVDEGWVTEADGLKNEYRHRSIPIVEPELLQRLREKPKTITLTPNRYHPEITQQVETTFIFHSPEGKPYQPHNWNNRVFVPFMRELQKAHPEIPTLSAHELRHTRASLWIAGGMEPYMAARLLGHTDLKMLLKIYDHTNVETLRKALEGARSDGEEERRA